MSNSKLNEREIADQFTEKHNLMVSYCEHCEGWYVHCPACDERVCCYVKFCCCNATIFQDKLTEEMNENGY